MEDKYAYSSITVATYIVAIANERRYGINMTKLQKLLYIAYGVYLAVKGSRLTDEHPQAWPYGPVFPTTRNKLLNVDFSTVRLTDVVLDEIRSNAEMNSLINLVFNSFGTRTATELTKWSHSVGSPWDRTVNGSSSNWGKRIPDEYIMAYFKTLITPKNEPRG